MIFILKISVIYLFIFYDEEDFIQAANQLQFEMFISAENLDLKDKCYLKININNEDFGNQEIEVHIAQDWIEQKKKTSFLKLKKIEIS